MSMKMQNEADARLSDVAIAIAPDERNDSDSNARASNERSHVHRRPDSHSRLLTQRKKRSGSDTSTPPTSTTTAERAGGTRRTTPALLLSTMDDGDWSRSAAASSSSSRSLASVNSTTCLVAHHSLAPDNDDDDDADSFSSTSSSDVRVTRRTAQRKDTASHRRASHDKRHSSKRNSSYTPGIAAPGLAGGVGVANAPPLSPPRSVARGSFRYLKPDEIERGDLQYDYAVIANRNVAAPSRFAQLLRACRLCCCNGSTDSLTGAAADPSQAAAGRRSSHERLGFRRLCVAHSPLLHAASEDAHRQIVDKLCREGLSVDIIDGGHSVGEMNSAYLILLVRASDAVIQSYVARFRFDLWIEHGAVADMALDVAARTDAPTPAERVQIVAFIIEQRAQIAAADAFIYDLFPMHDNAVTARLLTKWIASWRIASSLVDRRVLKQLRFNFGEKVAYYFAFADYYNRALLPLAVAGIGFEVIHTLVATTLYMRLLPFWGMSVCVVWSFGFLKMWDRTNASMQFEWNRKLHTKQIEYANAQFYGDKRLNALTGQVEIVYSPYRRIPKYICVGLFLLLQMIIMLVLVAIWVTIYEMLKASYPIGGLFTLQWWLILAEGIVFGMFVDVIQWNLIVTRMGRLFTHWENYKTEEQFERALIRKLFLLDFLNYYTWFFSLAFVFVIPGVGDYVTNSLNHMVFQDAMNCCFGPYVSAVDPQTCSACPLTNNTTIDCVKCVGFFTFDRHHVDLSAMFVTPIVVTQLLNIALTVLAPKLVRMRRERAQQAADAAAQARVMAAGSMQILGALDYNDAQSDQKQFDNKSQARYLEYSASEIEILNRQARVILFDSEQESYDPYNDFHALTVQFGFTVMFSMLWPLMPAACFAINVLKFRTDGYRLCKTLKRPIPRRANGIGAWRGIFTVYAYVAVVVNVLLVCISTGSLEFFDAVCVRDMAAQYATHNKTLDHDFVFGPDFGCLHVTYRLLAILGLEHVLLCIAYVVATRVPSVPQWIRVVMTARENQFKTLLRQHERDLFPDAAVAVAMTRSTATGGGRDAGKHRLQHNDKENAKENDDHTTPPPTNSSDRTGVLLSEAARLDTSGAGPSHRQATGSSTTTNRNVLLASDLLTRSLSIDSITPGSSERENDDMGSDLDVPSSDGFRSKAREQLARQWSVGSD